MKSDACGARHFAVAERVNDCLSPNATQSPTAKTVVPTRLKIGKKIGRN